MRHSSGHPGHPPEEDEKAEIEASLTAGFVIDLTVLQPIDGSRGSSSSGGESESHTLERVNDAIDWAIRDFSVLRVRDEWKTWAIGYGTKVSLIKLLKPAPTTVTFLSGLGTLTMMGATLIDATSPGMPTGSWPFAAAGSMYGSVHGP